MCLLIAQQTEFSTLFCDYTVICSKCENPNRPDTVSEFFYGYISAVIRVKYVFLFFQIFRRY